MFYAPRYALVAFGGDGVFDEPHPVTLHDQTFANYSHVGHFFNNVPSGKYKKMWALREIKVVTRTDDSCKIL